MALAGPARLALGWAKSEDLIQPILMPPKPAVYHPKPFVLRAVVLEFTVLRPVEDIQNSAWIWNETGPR